MSQPFLRSKLKALFEEYNLFHWILDPNTFLRLLFSAGIEPFVADESSRESSAGPRWIIEHVQSLIRHFGANIPALVP